MENEVTDANDDVMSGPPHTPQPAPAKTSHRLAQIRHRFLYWVI